MNIFNIIQNFLLHLVEVIAHKDDEEIPMNDSKIKRIEYSI